MENFKSPVARLARLFQTSRDAWKAKALDKQRRLRAAQIKRVYRCGLAIL